MGALSMMVWFEFCLPVVAVGCRVPSYIKDVDGVQHRRKTVLRG